MENEEDTDKVLELSKSVSSGRGWGHERSLNSCLF